LQEVKGVLEGTYSTTGMRGDGQVVLVGFTSYSVEVVPAFKLKNGKYWICNTNDGGSYKQVDPDAEALAVKTSNDITLGNTRDLIRMMKCWQTFCSVPLKSFIIELLSIEFLNSWQYKGKSSVYYDWMVREFLGALVAKHSYSTVVVPGTLEIIVLGDAWKSKADTAWERAKKACQFEAAHQASLAGTEWQKIFGTDIPTG